MIKRKSTEVGSSTAATAEEMELINKFTRKKLSADEVYTFNVVLCDNEVDRDFEYFTTETLFKLSDMFVGVTGIYDHNPSAKNQVARIYSCSVENMSPAKTAYGEDYCRLTAKAYMPKCEANSELITLLDAGIQKEVSVGCCISECVCSVCGQNMRTSYCGHNKGESYDGKLCCGVLKNPTDAYEWSFTAVPAQRNAGVIKSFFDGCPNVNGKDFFTKNHKEQGSFTINEDEYNALKDYVEKLEAQAEQTEKYKSVLRLETVKSAITARVDIDSDLLEAMVSGLSVEELLRLKEGFEKKSAKLLPVRSQIAGQLNKSDTSGRVSHNEYSI